MGPSLTPPQAMALLDAARTVADCAPQLARLASAAELQAHAAALSALVAARAHLDGQPPDRAARAVLDASIRILTRRVAIRATVGYAVDDDEADAPEQAATTPRATTAERQRVYRTRRRAQKDGGQ